MKHEDIPRSIDMEKSVLGSVLVPDGRGAIHRIATYLHPTDFYTPKHRKIYETMVGLYNDNLPVDLMTVSQRLDDQRLLERLGGTDYLADLIDDIPTSANIKVYARVVKDKAVLRNLISLGDKLKSNAVRVQDEVELDNLLSKSAKLIFDYAQARQGNKDQGLMELRPYLDRLFDEVSNKKLAVKHYLPTGYQDIDRRYGGLLRGGINVVAGRPGTGKTSFLLNICDKLLTAPPNPELFEENKEEEKKVIAFFSVEMSSRQIAERMVSSQAKISGGKLQRRALVKGDWAKLTKGISNLIESEFYIDDSPRLTPMDVSLKLQSLFVKTKKLDLIVIDYVQLMNFPGYERNRNLEIGAITGALKTIAREFDVPLLLASQLSRPRKGEEDRRPQLSDLRDSGAIEADAESAWFLYRSKQYKEQTNAPIEVLIEKNRHGPTGMVKLMFLGEHMRFEQTTRREE